MNNKTLSVISYLTIIGWLVAYRVHKDQAKRSTLVRYHLEQSLGLLIVSVILFVMISIMIVANANMIVFAAAIGMVELILTVMGMINAANEVCRPVPLLGRFFEKRFAFLS